MIQARVRLLTTEEGGRLTPLAASTIYRPNHNFFGLQDRRMCIGQIDLPEATSVNPGDTFETTIDLIIWPELRAEIAPGRTWLIQEGAKLVGIGEVIEVATRP